MKQKSSRIFPSNLLQINRSSKWVIIEVEEIGISRVLKFANFCNDKDLVINYKNTDLLRRYIDETGKIRPRRQTGACAKHQRAVAKAIKNARHIALLPFSSN